MFTGTVAKKPGMAFRNIYSTCLLIFCTIIVMAVIIDGNTKVAAESHPSVAIVCLWICILWLSMVEGGQASLVGLPPVDMHLYQDSHPTSHKIMTVVNRGDNLDRYLMGRQFMVLALVFVENLCGDPIDKTIPVLGMPIAINNIFLNTGLALFFMTAMLGKISAQVNASRCMLDYVNNFFAYFTFQVARIIEFSGLLHCCYLAQLFFSWAAGQPLESNEAPRNKWQQAFFWGRVLLSLAILGISFAVTLSALFHGQTTMWAGVPNGVAVVLFFIFMGIVGMLEGMQIAFFAVARMTDEERAKSRWAKRTCDVLFEGDGRNLPGFMVGRQMCVTLCFFIIARVTTIELEEGEPNIFGVSDGIQALFNTGLLGALITTICASITWQLVASAFPMAFLSTPITYVFMRFCLFLEWTGLCQGSWVVALIHRKCAGMKRDEVYIGTADERAALKEQSKLAKIASGEADIDETEKEGQGTLDKDGEYNVRPGHLYPGVPTLPPDFGHRTHTLEDIEELEQELTEHMEEVQKRLDDLRHEKESLQKIKGASSAEEEA